MPELSGRTRENLKAEVDLLGARENLAYAEKYLTDAEELQTILTGLVVVYKDHDRYLGEAAKDTEYDVSWATEQVRICASALDAAETNWKELGGVK